VGTGENLRSEVAKLGGGENQKKLDRGPRGGQEQGGLGYKLAAPATEKESRVKTPSAKAHQRKVTKNHSGRIKKTFRAYKYKKEETWEEKLLKVIIFGRH